jgi:hypothetical protein
MDIFLRNHFSGQCLTKFQFETSLLLAHQGARSTKKYKNAFLKFDIEVVSLNVAIKVFFFPPNSLSSRPQKCTAAKIILLLLLSRFPEKERRRSIFFGAALKFSTEKLTASSTWGRCYDVLNLLRFLPICGENFGVIFKKTMF